MIGKTRGVALDVQHITKEFKLPHESQNSLKGRLINFNKRGYEIQRVLDDISFTVYKGDFIGIVGRNGSGKSTLLKIISEIYTPNGGHVDVHGKLTPFIELGVGFNQELSGRDNVFLNGALLGFSRSEIEERYDDIVAFSELERFMDQKLKNYSSGMQVRLAFSIAIQADTDILVLDEVLAVGDEAFQRKCFEYFKALKRNGKTVVLVTHDMASVKKFCNRAILIEKSKLVLDGTPDEVANRYTLSNLEVKPKQQKKEDDDRPRPEITLEALSKTVLSNEDELKIKLTYTVHEDVPVGFGISVIDEVTNRASSVIDDGYVDEDFAPAVTSTKKGTYSYTYTLPLTGFNDRNFEVTAALFRKTKNGELVPYAFTGEKQILHFVIRNQKRGDNGLLTRKGIWQPN